MKNNFFSFPALFLSSKVNSFALTAAIALLVAFPLVSLAGPRPNSFNVQSAQAGSTTDIDNVRVTDLDTGIAVYNNSFDNPASATNGLRLAYWPVGGSDHTNFISGGSMTRVLNGRLRLETTGFNANGSGGYESHSEAEYTGNLPRNFLVEFDATRMQWPGHFHFHVFYRDPSDAPFSHQPGGAFSSNRLSKVSVDLFRMAASGSWFQEPGVITNFGKTNQAYAVKFPAPAGSLMQTARLGMSLSNTILSFYLNGNLLGRTNVSNLLPATESFMHGFKHVNETAVSQFLISSNNVRKYSEWQNPPTTYWGPSLNDQNSSITFKYTRPGRIVSGRLLANLASFNFPWPGYAGAGKGASSVWASKDGQSWILLLDNPTPANSVDSYKTFNAALPPSLLGGTELWVQIRMRTTGSPLSSYTTAQFSRSSASAPSNIYEVGLVSETPVDRDSDGDGLLDSVETNTGVFSSPQNTGTDPGKPDTDGDGLRDGDEVLKYGTNPVLADTNNDGISDGRVVSLGYSSALNFGPLLQSLIQNPVQGLFNQQQFDANRTSGRNDVVSAPRQYGLLAQGDVPSPLVRFAAGTRFIASIADSSWVRYSVSPGFLPAGWSFSSNTGTLSGIIRSNTSWHDVPLQAFRSNGASSASIVLSFAGATNLQSPITIQPTNLPINVR